MARNVEREVEALLAAESAADTVWRDLVVLLEKDHFVQHGGM